MPWRVVIVGVMALVSAVAAGCSMGTERDKGSPSAADGSSTTDGAAGPSGPRATLAGPLTAGSGISLVSTKPVDLAAAGWVEEELTAEGTAVSYRAVGGLPVDGRYQLEPDASAEYRTRLVVRRPSDAAAFNGTVVVEWLNVSGGLDTAPDFAYQADELLRGGYAWVGVSAQLIGVEGGDAAVTVAGAPSGGLRATDPPRYGSLHHPGDAFAYDMFTQVGRALRHPGATDALGGLVPQRVLAVGESQSAFMLTTYVNGMQPLTHAFDGFLIHSRGGAAAPLGEPGKGLESAAVRGGPATRIRTDSDVPVLVLETETDLLSHLYYYPARQPDAERFRLWEVAGTAHADAYLLGAVADLLDCGKPINAGPQHFVVKAALRSLADWVRTGEAPPQAARLEVDDSGATPRLVRDADGNVLGGIRTPQLDAPVAALSGDPGDSESAICALMGSTTPFTDDQLRSRYPTAADYLAAYQAAADAVIDAGFVLEDDRALLLADARPDRIPGGG